MTTQRDHSQPALDPPPGGHRCVVFTDGRRCPAVDGLEVHLLDANGPSTEANTALVCSAHVAGIHGVARRLRRHLQGAAR